MQFPQATHLSGLIYIKSLFSKNSPRGVDPAEQRRGDQAKSRCKKERHIPTVGPDQVGQAQRRDRASYITAGIHDGGNRSGEVGADVEGDGPGDPYGQLQSKHGQAGIPDTGHRAGGEGGRQDGSGGKQKSQEGHAAAGQLQISRALGPEVGNPAARQVAARAGQQRQA